MVLYSEHSGELRKMCNLGKVHFRQVPIIQGKVKLGLNDLIHAIFQKGHI